MINILFILLLLLHANTPIPASDGVGEKQPPSASEAASESAAESIDLTFTHRNGHAIALGESKEAAEAVLGSPIAVIDFLDRYEYEGLHIDYRGEEVSAILITDATRNAADFTTSNGVAYGDSYSTVQRVYGEVGIAENLYGSESLTYILERSGAGGYTFLTSPREITNKDEAYVLSFLFDEQDRVNFMMLADYYKAYLNE